MRQPEARYGRKPGACAAGPRVFLHKPLRGRFMSWLTPKVAGTLARRRWLGACTVGAALSMVGPAGARPRLSLRFARVEDIPDQLVGSLILEVVYRRLDIAVEFVDMPAKRALVESSEGRVDREVQRLLDVGREYPSLIAVQPDYAGSRARRRAAHVRGADEAAALVAGMAFSDRPAAMARVAAEFDDWAPALRALVASADIGPVLRPLHALPEAGHRWSRVPGVTLLGDAAHLMLPSGEGANLAMFDGAELARQLIAHPVNVETALGAYEHELFTRSVAEAVDAREAFGACYGDQAPRSLVTFLAGR
jgi:uncharacterized membrane protein